MLLDEEMKKSAFLGDYSPDEMIKVLLLFLHDTAVLVASERFIEAS